MTQPSANAPLAHMCDVAGCEELFDSLDDCIVHERTHAPSMRERMATLTPEQEVERQRLLADLREGAATADERRRQRAVRAAAREDHR